MYCELSGSPALAGSLRQRARVRSLGDRRSLGDDIMIVILAAIVAVRATRAARMAIKAAADSVLGSMPRCRLARVGKAQADIAWRAFGQG